MNQLQPLTDFQLLLGGIIAETLDVLARSLVLLGKNRVPLLHLLNLPLFQEKSGNTLGSAQREKCISHDGEKCDEICEAGQWDFHAECLEK